MLVHWDSTDGKTFVDVALEGVTPEAYQEVSELLVSGLEDSPMRAYVFVGRAMLRAIELCPEANPADLWVHLIYHEYRGRAQRTDQSWKRVSGDAFEYVVRTVYAPRLTPYDITLRRATRTEDAAAFGLAARGLGTAKTDIVLEGNLLRPVRFGVIHLKASIAERFSDDAPASVALIQQGYWSAAAVMDSKMFPPPHGDAVVRGEFGFARRASRQGQEDKRGYIERSGQFSACYSFNTRTPPSVGETPSGARIYSLTFTEEQPDALVEGVIGAWEGFRQRNP